MQNVGFSVRLSSKKRFTAAATIVACSTAYLLVGSAREASGVKNPLAGRDLALADKSLRVLAATNARGGVQLAAQLEATPTTGPAPVEPQQLDRASAASRMKLSGVERIRLRVWGSSDFNGEYGIDPDMTLSLPGLGRLDVGTLSLSDLEQLISDRLSSSLRRDTRVSVEVMKARPFFIMGQISRPGAVEWRPGLTLVQAIALAGGVTRPSLGGSPDQVLSARSQLNFTLAQLNRLKAEKEDVANTDPQAPVPSVDPAADSLPARAENAAYGQNIIRDEQRAVFQTRIANLQSEHRSVLREIETARAQSSALEEQRSLSRQATKDLEYLKERQLVANRVYLSQRSELSGIEARGLETAMALERAKTRAEALARQITLAKQERQAFLSERIETLEKEVVTIRSRVGADDSAPTDTRKKGIEFFVARNVNGDLDVSPVNIFGEILPGDVVIVFTRSAGEPLDTSKTAMLQWVLEASAQVPMLGSDNAGDGRGRSNR